jgi:hypothetical protein
VVDTIVDELSLAPELWHQRAYLARVISLVPEDGARDEGIVPLAAFVDGKADGGTPDAVALTLEADGSGAIYPVIYGRRAGAISEHYVEPDLLLRYDTADVRRRVAEIVAGFGVGAARP